MRAASMLALAASFAWCAPDKHGAPVTSSTPEPDAASPIDASLAPVADADAGEDAGAGAMPDDVPSDEDKALPALRPDAPARRYARLSHAACEAELVRRKVPYSRGEAKAGVRSPVRLTGPLHGVTIHSESSAKRRAKAAFEIFDCRLVLALDDFAAFVAAKDVVEIRHMSAYRSWKERGCTSKGSKQHCGALAVDVGEFVKSDGTRLIVDRDFNGRVGQRTCVATTKPVPSTAPAEELWGYVCEAARRMLFNVVLTPNFNVEHKNHFHLEVTPGVDWMLIH